MKKIFALSFAALSIAACNVELGPRGVGGGQCNTEGCGASPL